MSSTELQACMEGEQLPAGRYVYTKFAGRGLGMSAILGIIRSHRGALHLMSEVGKGTTITVYFPVPSQQGVC